MAAGEDALIRGWDASSKNDVPVFEISGHNWPVNCLLVHNDNLFSGSSDRTIRQWSLMTQKLIRGFTGIL